MPLTLTQLSARVSPARIGFVRFILESYDGLAVLSTTDPASGELVFRFYPAQHEELLALLADLGVTVI